jgi:hypothetical protein
VLRALPPLGRLSRIELAAGAPGGRQCFYLPAGALADGLLPAAKLHAAGSSPSSAAVALAPADATAAQTVVASPPAAAAVAAAAGAAAAQAPYPRLTTLGLRGQRNLGARDAAALVAQAPALSRLNLSGAFWRTDGAGAAEVAAAAEGVDLDVWFGLALLPRLEVLLFANTQPDEGLADDDIRSLVSGIALAADPLHPPSRLVVLDLGGHAALTDVALETIAAHGMMCARLRKIGLSRQSRITRRGLLALLRASPQLETIIAVRCNRLSHRVLAAVGRQLTAEGDERSLRLSVDREGGDGAGDDDEDEEEWWVV